jgi:hypothetical protein
VNISSIGADHREVEAAHAVAARLRDRVAHLRAPPADLPERRSLQMRSGNRPGATSTLKIVFSTTSSWLASFGPTTAWKPPMLPL